ncbi:hypothetical protein HYT26_03110 [Candidatus Pacearchaeota archaeon]|nr:hypothetical protein [Candidatus Pacearchaeota archaeon]
MENSKDKHPYREIIRKAGETTEEVFNTLLSVPFFLMFLFNKMPPTATESLIPRLTNKSKIRFLEGQLRKVEEHEYNLFQTTYAYHPMQLVYLPRNRYTHEELKSKREGIVRQLIPLYESLGMHDKIDSVKKEKSESLRK